MKNSWVQQKIKKEVKLGSDWLVIWDRMKHSHAIVKKTATRLAIWMSQRLESESRESTFQESQ